jgi:hypothetical protein
MPMEPKWTWRNIRHLIPLGLVFLGGTAGFLVLRGAMVPDGFGALGHFRAGAIGEVRMQPVAFAGQAACAECHPSEAETRNSGKHKTLACEGCHGPLARHAADPAAVQPPKPDTASLCVRCHERDGARPPSFPQVIAAEHSGGEACATCHKAHNPKP